MYSRSGVRVMWLSVCVRTCVCLCVRERVLGVIGGT